MGNSVVSCAGKFHNGDVECGAPRPDGSDCFPRQELERRMDATKAIEDVLMVCNQNSNVSDKNQRQRNDVEDMIMHFGSHCSSVGKTCSTASESSVAAQVGVVNSQLRFMDPDQTIIIFDWDDTLCPSTFMKRHIQATRGPSARALRGPINDDVQHELEMLTDQVIPLLRAAQAMGKVVLVTNAKRPWVNTSCGRWIPKLQETLKGIDVVYAMEFLNDTTYLTTDTLVESKAKAMRSAVSEFYSRYAGQSWKNLISVGDALYEHEAIRQVAAERPGAEYPGTWKKCRTKTVKLIESPTISGMVMQLGLLENWLAKIVLKDGDVDIDFAAPESKINRWIVEYGNDGRCDNSRS